MRQVLAPQQVREPVHGNVPPAAERENLEQLLGLASTEVAGAEELAVHGNADRPEEPYLCPHEAPLQPFRHVPLVPRTPKLSGPPRCVSNPQPGSHTRVIRHGSLVEHGLPHRGSHTCRNGRSASSDRWAPGTLTRSAALPCRPA